jgi:YbbR domain-containing protein
VAGLLRKLTQNWKLKLLAFALAILLWVVVSAEEVTSRWIDVPLQVRVTDPEYLLRAGVAPEEVSVRFSGPRRELVDLRFRRPPLVLNILDVEDERQVFTLQGRMVQVPTQLAVNVVDLQPSVVDLRFIRVDTRTFPVRVTLARELPEGWLLADTLTLRPARVRISGPDSRLNAIDTVRTLPITLPVADTAFELVAALDTSQFVGLRLSARRIEVAGRVDRVQERTYTSVPVSVGPGITIRPSTVDVRLRGPRRTVEQITPGELRVAIAIDSIPVRIPPEGLPVPLRVDRPRPGVQASIEPSGVRIYPERTILDTIAVPRVGEPIDTVPPAPTRER